MSGVWAQLDGFRDGMLRFALLQLRNRSVAEDAVQEAMLAALEGAQRFDSRSQLKTWVFSILKHKIIDIIRQRSREPLLDCATDELPEDAFDPLFSERGHWQKAERPSDWGNPEKSLENTRFWTVFEACLDHLPENTARIFMMREFLGLDTEEICKAVGITPTNCWVVLHRARMGLRLCLEETWFDTGRK
ncbi:RNA polymerase sigma factor [Sulfurimicrobium lacus]|uniref:RNA polymerase sigma factor n=2 Tax=Sulfurimicrobium lacus TaxID=2715678 RepID=A0A6F8VCI8_9PROT|nr:RNA polymerase sigma factor [Sulfurimicrobium lacus]